LDYAVKSINVRQQAIGEKVEALSTDIAVYFDELRQSIDRREESLLQKLKEIKVQKVTTLEEQRQTIREHTEELKRAHQFVDSVCYPQKHSNTEILDLYFTMKQRLQDLLEQCKDVQLNPLEEVDIVFDGDERLGKALQSKFEILGAVRAGQVFEEEAKVTTPVIGGQGHKWCGTPAPAGCCDGANARCRGRGRGHCGRGPLIIIQRAVTTHQLHREDSDQRQGSWPHPGPPAQRSAYCGGVLARLSRGKYLPGCQPSELDECVCW